MLVGTDRQVRNPRRDHSRLPLTGARLAQRVLSRRRGRPLAVRLVSDAARLAGVWLSLERLERLANRVTFQKKPRRCWPERLERPERRKKRWPNRNATLLAPASCRGCYLDAS